MQVLEIRRLTPAETDTERSRITEYDPTSDRSFPLPTKIGASDLCKRLGIGRATLHRYRKLALEKLTIYIDESLRRNDRYIVGETNIPDKPPFSRLQAEILQEISLLYDKYDNTEIVEAELDRLENHYQKTRG